MPKKRGPGRPPVAATKKMNKRQFRIDDRQWRQLTRAAKKVGLERSVWMRRVLREAAEELLQ